MLLCYFVTEGNLKICYVNSNAIYSVSTRYLPEKLKGERGKGKGENGKVKSERGKVKTERCSEKEQK